MATDVTLLICGECGEGYFKKNPMSAAGPVAGYANCDECGHMVSLPLDIVPNMDEGEFLTIADGLVGYTTFEEN